MVFEKGIEEFPALLRTTISGLQVVSFKNIGLNIGAFLQKYRDTIGIFKKYFQHIKQRDPFYCLICLHFLHSTKQY